MDRLEAQKRADSFSHYEKTLFLRAAHTATQDTQPYEIKMMTAVLGVPVNGDEWRFARGVQCSCCRRSFTNFDFFMATVTSHGTEFVRKRVIAAQVDNATSEIKIATGHDIELTCIACGTVEIMSCSRPECTSYIYRYAGTDSGYRLSPDAFSLICKLANL